MCLYLLSQYMKLGGINVTNEERNEFRKFFQRIKSTSLDNFVDLLNRMHSKAYALAQREYREAMFIVLQPKQIRMVEDKLQYIRGVYDGHNTVKTQEGKQEWWSPTPIETKEEILDENLLKAEIKALKKEIKRLNNELNKG